MKVNQLLLAALTCLPLPLAAQEKSLPQQIADVIVQLNGGVHTGFRFMHAKGLVVTGTFTAAPSARSISQAAHLAGGSVPVTVRFSDGTGNPMIPDPDTRGHRAESLSDSTCPAAPSPTSSRSLTMGLWWAPVRIFSLF